MTDIEAVPAQEPKKKSKKVKVFGNKKKKAQPEIEIIGNLKKKYDQIDLSTVTSFAHLPLSAQTLKGLKECGYTKPTDIQRETIKLALSGKDILGAAQTGSGKTLAFLIPVIETLYCHQWSKLDGVGALIITPTRELAYQIFETLRKIGEHHEFSAGLIIGGKDLKFERNRMDQCNIIICTPGRILQHMDENPLLNIANMKILVLDEADRCLDMGFSATMNAIIANLPIERQTLLFSATQTKSVKDLARLSLENPSYVAVHESLTYSTPAGLHQTYTVCELHDKISILWSFIKNHLKNKTIIFFSSCKQVKYMFEIFSKLRPGTSLLALYGSLHQLRRMDIYESFCNKKFAILFATDLAARGLDFPEVNWVVQADCPEDPETYIHRVGRTARYKSGGESLLLLLPSEEPMVEALVEKKIPIEKIDINPERLRNPVRKIEAYLAKNPALKESAQRAFKSYAKAIYLMKNKKVFRLQDIDTNLYAKSLGLAIPPRIRFLERQNKLKAATSTKIEGNDENQEDEEEFEHPTTQSTKLPFQLPEDSDDDDILKVKRLNHDIEGFVPDEAIIPPRVSKKKAVTKAAIVKKILNKNIIPNKKITFGEDGEIVDSSMNKKSELAQEYENEDVGGIDIEKAKLILQEEDKIDKQTFKEKVKAKHREAKRKLKEQRKRGDEEEVKDEFGTDSEGEEPDLSWLPDPDKIYGKKEDGDDSDEFYVEDKEGRIGKEDGDDSDEFYVEDKEGRIGKDDLSHEEEEKVEVKKNKKEKVKKRKSKVVDDGVEDVKPKKKKKKNKLENISEGLSVNEAEELAMLLLSGMK